MNLGGAFIAGLMLLAVQTPRGPESAAVAAEQRGDVRGAFDLYVSALQQLPEWHIGGYSEQDARLRRQIVRLSSQLRPPPRLSPAAQEFATLGRKAMDAATDRDGFLSSEDMFRKALRLAPWDVAIVFNLVLAQEQLEAYTAAVENLRVYIGASPADAADARARLSRLEEWLAADEQTCAVYLEENLRSAAQPEGRRRKGPWEKLIDLGVEQSLQGRLGLDIFDAPRTGAGRRGAIVYDVKRGGPGDASGLRMGDQIVELNGMPVESSAHVARVIDEMRHGASSTAVVLRNGKTFALKFRKPKEAPDSFMDGGGPHTSGCGSAWTI